MAAIRVGSRQAVAPRGSATSPHRRASRAQALRVMAVAAPIPRRSVDKGTARLRPNRSEKRDLPPPPEAPEELLRFPVERVAPKMLGTLAVLAGLLEVAALAAGHDEVPLSGCAWGLSMLASGVVSLPLLQWQHDLVHLREDKRTPLTDALEPALAVITGVPLAVSHFVHEFHHAVPTNYKGLDVDAPPQPHNTAEEVGDPDDTWFVLRRGLPLRVVRLHQRYPALRAATVGLVALKSMLIFQPIAMAHGVIRPVEAELDGRGNATNRVGLAAVVLHMLIGQQLVGLGGLALYSAGLSAAGVALGTIFHDQTGLTGNDDSWYQQLAATANPRDHDHPLIKHLLNGQDYHIEHHLWPKVPSENLAQMMPVAKRYAEENGFEYMEVEPMDAFRRSLQVGWDLAALSTIEYEAQQRTERMKTN